MLRDGWQYCFTSHCLAVNSGINQGTQQDDVVSLKKNCFGRIVLKPVAAIGRVLFG
jgi:hypothetical protein